MVESNFDAESDVEPFRRLERERDLRLVQIHCGGPTDRIVEHFADRASGDRRHPGHDDDPEDAEEVRRKLDAGLWEPLELPGELIAIDVVAEDVDHGELAARVRAAAD